MHLIATLNRILMIYRIVKWLKPKPANDKLKKDKLNMIATTDNQSSKPTTNQAQPKSLFNN